jgi:hypothetical protein
MGSGFLLPPVFWFRFTFACLRVEGIPRKSKAGPLLDLPESCRLPETVRLEDREPWAEIRAGWNHGGLGFQVTCRGKTGRYVDDEDLPEASDGVQLWIDTRDTRDIHRASRFCHRYSAVVVPSGRSFLSVKLRQRKLNRAAADPVRVRPENVQTRAERTTDGWRLELFFSPETLNGFDPEVNRRLGFYAVVTDPARGDQPLGTGRDFPTAEDPSLWNTLELVDRPARE